MTEGVHAVDSPVNRTPVVLIHGVGLDSTMWDGVALRLGADRRVITYDMIGHGRAERPPGPYTLDLFVRQLGDVVADLGSGPVDVVGFSMGALVAQGFAIARPDRVRRLALLHSVFDRNAEDRSAVVGRVADARAGGFIASVETALQRWFTPAFAVADAAAVAKVRGVLLANDVDAYANAYEVFATADADLVEPAGLIACPTLVMTGSDDARSTPAMARLLAERVHDGESVVLPGLRHLAPIEDPETVATQLRSFLDRDRP